MKHAWGVLLVSHGTVDSLDDLPEFLRNVRHGREAPPELVRELRKRYAEIGGSPLDAINVRLAAKLERVLGITVRRASRLWHPYPKDVVGELRAERVVVLPLAQHSAHVYGEAVQRELGGVEVRCAENWGRRPALLEAYARRACALADPDAALLLTAHSLPKRVIDSGDPYEREVRAAAAGVAERVAGAFAETVIAFQSQGPGSDASEWLGPTLGETLDAIASRRKRVVVAPIGFLADHVEILYDLDVEAKAMAEARGMSFARTESLNDSEDLRGGARRPCSGAHGVTKRVVVVGAGMSGLACAWALRGRADVVVVESGARVGGNVLTERRDGFVMDAGPDAWITTKPDATALAREAGLESELVGTRPEFRRVYVAWKSRLYPMPEGVVLGVPTRIAPMVTTRLFSLRGKARMGLEPFVRRRRFDGDEDEAVGDFVERRLGREASD